MFTKTKLRIEHWLRGIVADEVSKIDTDLQREKFALYSQLMLFDAQLQGFKETVDRLIEVSEHSQENIVLRDTIKQIDAQLVGLKDTVKRLHP